MVIYGNLDSNGNLLFVIRCVAVADILSLANARGNTVHLWKWYLVAIESFRALWVRGVVLVCFFARLMWPSEWLRPGRSCRSHGRQRRRCWPAFLRCADFNGRWKDRMWEEGISFEIGGWVKEHAGRVLCWMRTGQETRSFVNGQCRHSGL